MSIDNLVNSVNKVKTLITNVAQLKNNQRVFVFNPSDMTDDLTGKIVIIAGSLSYVSFDESFQTPAEMVEVEKRIVKVFKDKKIQRVFLHKSVINFYRNNNKWLPILYLDCISAFIRAKKGTVSIVYGQLEKRGGLMQIASYESGFFTGFFERQLSSGADSYAWDQELEALISGVKQKNPSLPVSFVPPIEKELLLGKVDYIDQLSCSQVGVLPLDLSKHLTAVKMDVRPMQKVASVVVVALAVLAYTGVWAYQYNKVNHLKADYLAQVEPVKDRFSEHELKKMQMQKQFLEQMHDRHPFSERLPGMLNTLATLYEGIVIKTFKMTGQENDTASLEVVALFPKFDEVGLLQAEAVLGELSNKTGWQFSLEGNSVPLAIVEHGKSYWQLSFKGKGG